MSHKWDEKYNRNIPKDGLIVHLHPAMTDKNRPSPQSGLTKTNIYDLSGLGHSVSLQSFDTLASNVYKGNNTIDNPYSIMCDGINDRLSVPDHPAFDLINTLTFAFWIKPTDWGLSDFPRLLERWSYSAYFNKSDSTLKVKLDTNIYTSSPIFVTGIWQFIAVTWNNTLLDKHLKIYKDDQLINEIDTHTNDLNIVTTSDMHIMNRYDSLRSFYGEMGPCYIYNRALDSSEVAQLYSQKPILRKKFVA